MAAVDGRRRWRGRAGALAYINGSGRQPDVAKPSLAVTPSRRGEHGVLLVTFYSLANLLLYVYHVKQ